MFNYFDIDDKILYIGIQGGLNMKLTTNRTYEIFCKETLGQEQSAILNDWYLGKLMFLLKRELGIVFDKAEKECFEKYLQENIVLSEKRKKLMREIKQIFEDNEIDVIFFKGEFLSSVLYNETIRPVGDLDIYVLPEVIDKSLALLEKNGYLLKDANGSHHIRLEKDDFRVELHKNILNPFTKIGNSFFTENVCEMSIDGLLYKTFNPTATFIHLIYHLYMDTMLVNNNYSIMVKQTYNKARRFLYRVYEIASYIEMYSLSIDETKIYQEIEKHTYNQSFINMLFDIYSIYSDIVELNIIKNIIDLASQRLEKKGELEQYVCDAEGDCAKAMSKYLSERWESKEIRLGDLPFQLIMDGKDKNVLNATGTYVLGEYPATLSDFSSFITVQKKNNGINLNIQVCDDVLIFDNAGVYDSCKFDCIGLFFVNLQPYVYKQIFLFPHYSEERFCVDVFNVITREIEELKASVKITENGYQTEIFVPYDFFGNELSEEFLMEIHIADCDDFEKNKKTTFALSGKNQLWYDPCNFVKFIK